MVRGCFWERVGALLLYLYKKWMMRRAIEGNSSFFIHSNFPCPSTPWPIHIHWGATYSLAHSFHLFNSTTRSLCWYSARRKDITFRFLVWFVPEPQFLSILFELSSTLNFIQYCVILLSFYNENASKRDVESRAKLIKAKYISEFEWNGMINVVQFTDEYPFLFFFAIP